MKTAMLVVAILGSTFAASYSAAQEGALHAGTARADITPPVGSRMYGYGARGTSVSEGVHDPLHAKALVLDNGNTRLAVVTLDLGSFSAENTANVKAIVQQKADIQSFLFVASHTHSAPAFSDDFPSPEAPWVRQMERDVADAIVAASQSMQPARVGAGWGEVREGHNRRMIRTDGEVVMLWANRDRMPTHPVDYSVGIIRVESHSGKTIATLVNYACHPVVLGPQNLLLSADFAGAFTRMAEAELGGECMFLQGASGDINPFWDKTPPEEGGFEQVERMGRAIADEVVRVSRHIVEFSGQPRISAMTETVPLRPRQVDAADAKDLQAEVNTILIGDQIAIAAFPGEFFVEHGLRLKSESVIPHTFFVGYANDQLAYFPTIRAVTEGGYGADVGVYVEAGAGETLVNRALINLYRQAGLITP